MEIYSNERMEYLSRPSRLIKKCLNCGSVFINEKECEDCGFQFFNQEIGEPVDERSFYSIRESFFEAQNFFERIFLKKRGKKYKEFRNRLLYRYRILLKSMESPWEDLSKWNYFHYELIDLTKYLSSDPFNNQILDKVISGLSFHPFLHEIKSAREEAKNISKSGPFLERKTKITIILFLIATVLISISPSIFKIIK